MSWGPPDDGKTMDTINRLPASAITKGVTEVCLDKGIIPLFEVSYNWVNVLFIKKYTNLNCLYTRPWALLHSSGYTFVVHIKLTMGVSKPEKN